MGAGGRVQQDPPILPEYLKFPLHTYFLTFVTLFNFFPSVQNTPCTTTHPNPIPFSTPRLNDAYIKAFELNKLNFSFIYTVHSSLYLSYIIYYFLLYSVNILSLFLSSKSLECEKSYGPEIIY